VELYLYSPMHFQGVDKDNGIFTMIWGSHCGDCDDYCFLSCDTVKSVK